MKKLFIKLINLYKKLTVNNKKRCRFTPSCSDYAKECFERFNVFKALLLTIYRILRCNPLFKGGYDPVPLTTKEKKVIKNMLPKVITEDKFNPFNITYKIRIK